MRYETRDIGRDVSAQGWLGHMGPNGDCGRGLVLDAPMLERMCGMKQGACVTIMRLVF